MTKRKTQDTITTTADTITTTADTITTTADTITTTADPITTTADPITTTADPITTTADPITTTADTITTTAVESDDARISREARERMEALTTSRDACVSGIKKGDGLVVTYARNISAVCGEGWVYLVGREAATVKAERKLFDRAMGMPEESLTIEDKKLKAKCNEYWIRIKKAAGYVPKGKVSGAVTIDAKNLAELKTMINRILNEESEADSCPLSSEAKGSLIEAFETLGGDATTLGTKA